MGEAIDWDARMRGLDATSLPRLAGELAAMADEASAAWQAGQLQGASLAALTDALLSIVQGEAGAARARLACGELLGRLGDPRLRLPADADYWSWLTLQSGDTFALGRFPVTNHEYRAWVDAGGYGDHGAWTPEGLAWLSTCADPWPELAKQDDAEAYLIANQPVVGVSWYEAQAYATAMGARLPRFYERVWAVRGPKKRPYPWGDPFGEGHANTKEEVLGRPCAVGLYPDDCTPEGIYDLAGNAGEWTADAAGGGEYLLHPGSWDQPSLASWAKALTAEKPTARWAALGFRLAKD
ncbi:MAG: SUMF1/EgtB/PvdO family nonheme iron enzyme [Alphaproteobacteria bacterium]|nr:SUMF1/EgtB/PvdO family nonheme iron enzyme [Alphaproteobacteria bacterium]